MKQKWNSDFVDPQLLQSEESFLVLRKMIFKLKS